ncbi:MAG: hypothetical protein COY81_01035 [Candidatus Pacebacteria bacterium CG_4_10_14_0_8_um_filter_43_12]|nr:MAG: hypothetical protein COY81_01035 [Candidatus Pacebacteria bacterium CG_4_10_14_0_8_um_filter_43_12]
MTKKIILDQPGVKKILLDQPGEFQLFLTVPGVEAVVFGAFQTVDKEQTAVKVVVHHQAPHTKAVTNLRGVAGGSSKISFTGRIIIDKNCGDTNSFLTERILLLSDNAKAEAIPDLEILTDDVKCSHAASISRIPEAQLFYLMSRGILRKRAEGLIVQGFLAEKK